MMAGFDNARGDVIVPIDGDLQNDPADIPHLVEMLDQGFDVVSGWRKNRSDDLILRKIPSWIANAIISRVSGVKLHDYGCTLKAYRRDVLSGVRLYGELHRFVPIFASWQGGRITEMVVNHRPRERGVSKYGINRVFKVVLDLMLVRFLTKYQAKAIYVFGAVGLFFFAIAFAASLYAVYLKIFNAISFILTPLPLIAAFGFMTGFMCILLGLIAELLARTYFESQGRLPYIIAFAHQFRRGVTTVMCGIAGFAGIGTYDDVVRMTHALAHRGPDGDGVYVDDAQRVFLGHRRLAIIDIAGGVQPMANDTGTTIVVFNGEIYNHRSLRRELVALGQRFRSDHSDTEVVIRGYDQWGEAVVERLEGMFAFAIYDASRGKLLLARDRFGEKPLFYTHRGLDLALPPKFRASGCT